MSSCDLTPPISPSLDHHVDECSNETVDQEFIPWFSCKSQAFESYLKSRYFEMVLNTQLKIYDKSIIVLFGKRFSKTCVLRKDLQLLFSEVKKTFFIVKAYATERSNVLLIENPATSILHLRKDVCNFFTFILSQLQFVTSNKCSIAQGFEKSMDVNQIVTNLIKEVKHLLVFINCISNIPNILHTKDFTDGSKNSNYYYHYVHLSLDIWLNSVLILHILNAGGKITERSSQFYDNQSYFDFYPLVTSVLLNDLVTITVNSYKSSFVSSNYSPFLCKCFQDIWIILLVIIDRSVGESSFWNSYFKSVQSIINLKSDKINDDLTVDLFNSSRNIDINSSNIIESCLWFTSHIAQLYQYDINGLFSEFLTPKSGYPVVKFLVNSLLTGSYDEKKLRSAFFYTLQLIAMWEPSCEILLQLTDFYMKKLEETFCLSGCEVRSLSYLYSNSITWYENLNNLLSTCSVLGEKSSFEIYLQMIATQLLKVSTENNLWRSLKGRLYSKFGSKKIKEMSEVGLQNSFSVLLIIALSGHLEISDKICELAATIDTTLTISRQKISWKAVFVLMHILEQKNQSLGKIASKVSTFFNKACTMYAAGKDHSNKTNIMSLLLVYIDNISEIFERSHSLRLSEFQLISSGFSILLSNCGITELNYILGIFLNILMTVQNKVSNSYTMENAVIEYQYTEFLDFILKHIFPIVENLSLSNTPPMLVADIAAVITDLVCRFPESSTLSFQNIFLHFGIKDTTNSSIVCRYLCFVLDNEKLIFALKEKVSDFNVLLLQSWLKCNIFLHTYCNEMQDLTSKVLLQTDFSELFPRLKNLNFKTTDHVYMSIALFRIMGETFSAISDLHQKNQMRLKVHNVFKKYANCVSERIKKQCDGMTLGYIYKLISNLVENCSMLLHLKFNPESVLPQLLDQTIFPHIVFPKDKPSQTILTSAIKDHLPGFIKGLFKLDFKSDKCIEREIKDILINYSCLYPLSSNPISKLCLDSINCKSNSLKPEALEFLLNIMKLNVLSNPNQTSTHGFEMCFELLKCSPLPKQAYMTDLLLKSALDFYMKHNSIHCEFLRNLIKRCLVYFKNNAQLSFSKTVLTPIIEWFISDKLQWSSARGFGVLDSIAEYLPEVLSDLVPFLTKTVEELENQRGFGMDVNLRNQLRNVIEKLQRKLSKR